MTTKYKQTNKNEILDESRKAIHDVGDKFIIDDNNDTFHDTEQGNQGPCGTLIKDGEELWVDQIFKVGLKIFANVRNPFRSWEKSTIDITDIYEKQFEQLAKGDLLLLMMEFGYLDDGNYFTGNGSDRRRIKAMINDFSVLDCIDTWSKNEELEKELNPKARSKKAREYKGGKYEGPDFDFNVSDHKHYSHELKKESFTSEIKSKSRSVEATVQQMKDAERKFTYVIVDNNRFIETYIKGICGAFPFLLLLMSEKDVITEGCKFLILETQELLKSLVGATAIHHQIDLLYKLEAVSSLENPLVLSSGLCSKVDPSVNSTILHYPSATSQFLCATKKSASSQGSDSGIQQYIEGLAERLGKREQWLKDFTIGSRRFE